MPQKCELHATLMHEPTSSCEELRRDMRRARSGGSFAPVESRRVGNCPNACFPGRVGRGRPWFVAQLDVDEALLHAAIAAMSPYVRRMIARGMTYGLLEARVRELFVKVAERDFPPSGPEATDSRVSILTGINRKEVRRIRSLDRDAAPRSFMRNLAASLVSRWVTDPRLTDGMGRPLALPYDAARGPSFVKLAKGTTADLGPRALLDVLVGAGAAVQREDDLVTLTKTAYVPQRKQSAALAMLADDPPELIETMLHNVLSEGEDSRLQQKLAYDNIGRDGLTRLIAVLRREAARFLERSNAVLVRHDRDRNARAPGGERMYAGIGVYYFEATHEQRTTESASNTPRRKRGRKRETRA